MSDKLWKRAEREIASRLGGKRVPVSGRQRGDTPDIEHPDFSLEVKNYAKPPGWAFVEDAFDQATASVVDGNTPVVCVHKVGTPYDDTVVMMKLSDFVFYLKGDNDG